MIVADDIAPLIAALGEMAENVDTLRRYAQALHSSLPAAEPVETTEASAAAVSPLPLPRRADEGWIAGATHSPDRASALPPVVVVPAGAPLDGAILPELPPVAPRAPAALSAKPAAWFAVIRERAETGGPTPGVEDCRKATGIKGSILSAYDRALVKHGLVRIHGSRDVKVYEVVETGKRTAKISRFRKPRKATPGPRKPRKPRAAAASQAVVAPAPAVPVRITHQAAPPSAPWATWRAPVVYRKPRSTPPVGAGGKLF